MLFFKYNAKRKKKERNAQGLYEETLWGLGRIRTGEPRLREQGSAASSCRSSQVRLQSQYSIGCVRGEVGATQGITSNEKTLQRKNQEERLTCLDATTFYKAELAWRWEEHVSVLGRPGVLCTRRPGCSMWLLFVSGRSCERSMSLVPAWSSLAICAQRCFRARSAHTPPHTRFLPRVALRGRGEGGHGRRGQRAVSDITVRPQEDSPLSPSCAPRQLPCSLAKAEPTDVPPS